MNNKVKTIIIASCFLLVVPPIAILGPRLFSTPEPYSAPNPIQLENQLLGSTAWQITNGATDGQIQAYAGENSINKGESLHLYVSTTSPTYDIEIYRLGYYSGLGGRLIQGFYDNVGMSQGYYSGYGVKQWPPRPANCNTCITTLKDSKEQETDITDAHWKVTKTINFLTSWVSGIYVIKLTETLGGYQWEVPVVLRDDHSKADLVFENPVNTEEAYNWWGGTALYNDFRIPGRDRAYYVSFNRPYIDDYGTMNLFRWTYPMVRFLEQEGYNVTYTENSAVSEGKTDLLNYKAFVVGGHDEYWSYAERQKLETAISKGVSAAFFGANDIYWQIRYASDTNGNHDRFIICYKDASLDPVHSSSARASSYLTTVKWRDLGNPEDKILKTMYVSNNSYVNQDLVFTNTNNWIFKNTSIKDGYTIKGILGFEVDTLFNDDSITSNDNVTIIAKSKFLNVNKKASTAYAIVDELKDNGNIVFNAGTYLWDAALSDFPIHHHLSQPIVQSKVLMQITNNILYRMIHGKTS